jgi:hypothetical protein
MQRKGCSTILTFYPIILGDWRKPLLTSQDRRYQDGNSNPAPLEYGGGVRPIHLDCGSREINILLRTQESGSKRSGRESFLNVVSWATNM